MSDAPQATPQGIIARQLSADDVGARGVLKWLKVSMPKLYKDILPDLIKLNAQAKAANPTGLGAFGDSGTSDVPASSAPASSSWSDSLLKLIQGWGQYKLTDAQLDLTKQLAQTNLQRAQQGLAPIAYDAGQLGLAPTVNVGLSGDTGKLVMYGGFGLIGFLLFNTFMKHGRR